MKLRNIDISNLIGAEVPDCILDEPLEKHIPNINEFSSFVLAGAFNSGPQDNPTAVSFVFYFFRGDVNHNSRPDDILTFKVKLNNPGQVHIIDKYLGGASFGAENAPPLSQIHG